MAIKINGNTVIADNQAFTSTSTISATGQITGGNINSLGNIDATGNINAGNINVGNGDITGNVIVSGSGEFGILPGQTVLSLSNARAETVYIGAGKANLLYIGNSQSNTNFGGNISVAGNITAGTITANVTTSTISASGNITGGNLRTAGAITATGNITGGNILTAGGISATGVIQGGNLTVGNAIVTGNLTVQGTETIFNVANLTVNDKDIIVANNVTGGANVDGSGIQAGNPATATWFFNNATTSWQSNIGITPTTNGTLSLGGASNYWGTAFVTTASVTGNVQGGNIRTAGLISATGNITGNFFIGNGSQLTGIDATAIQNGTANVRTFNNGNVTTSAGGTANVLNVTSTGTITTGTVSATGNISGSFFIGNGSQLTGIDATAIQNGTANVRTFNNGNVTTSAGGTANVLNVTSTGTITTGTASVSGNVTGGNILTAGLISATGAITGAAITGTSLTVSTGNVTAGNIVNGNANGVGNIGSSTTYFNTVFAKATSAQYADLAEKYTADAAYPEGTVVAFGGSQEVTISNVDKDSRVAGVISTNPSYIMNGTLEAAHVATVALTGRVPTRVTGSVRKGDLMVSAGNGVARAEANPPVGTVIGKALADSEGDTVIEVVVGRF